MTRKGIIFFFISFLFTASCKEKGGDAKMKAMYYSSGSLKSYGKYLRDSIPIDTVHYFYENGMKESIAIYDSLGFLNGTSTLFFPNGNLDQQIHYVHGKAVGYSFQYDSNGNLKHKLLYYDDTQVGDVYSYRDNGEVQSYTFVNFYGNKMNNIVYDSLNQVKELMHRLNFIDSITVEKKLNDKYRYELLLIFSNPPKTSNRGFVEYRLKGNNHKLRDTVEPKGEPYTLITKEFKSDLLEIGIHINQFDSITRRYRKQEKILKIEY